jgi:hypothetical protein
VVPAVFGAFRYLGLNHRWIPAGRTGERGLGEGHRHCAAEHLQPGVRNDLARPARRILGALVIARGKARTNHSHGLLHDQTSRLPGLAAFLFATGIFGMLRRRTLIGMLISGELIFSAAS